MQWKTIYSEVRTAEQDFLFWSHISTSTWFPFTVQDTVLGKKKKWVFPNNLRKQQDDHFPLRHLSVHQDPAVLDGYPVYPWECSPSFSPINF